MFAESRRYARIICCDIFLSPWYIASTPRNSTPAVARHPSGTSGFRPPKIPYATPTIDAIQDGEPCKI